jgi:hypothetical protein
MRNSGGEQFAVAGAHQGRKDQIGGFVLAGAEGRDQTDPAADFAVAQNSEAVADGMNLGGETEGGRIQVAQEPVAE